MQPESLKQKKKYRAVIEAILVVGGLAIFAGMLHYHTPKIISILESGNVTDVENYIQNAGTKGRYILILLQIIETVSIVLPAVPVYICAGVLFGKLQGFLMCYLTNLVMNFLIFVAARKLHITTNEFSKAAQNKTLEKLMHFTDKPVLLVILMCLVPVMPNGMIPYICSQGTMKLSSFMEGLAVGSLPAILLYVCCGDFLVSMHWKKILPVLAVLLAVLVLCVLFKKQLTAVIEKHFLKNCS